MPDNHLHGKEAHFDKEAIPVLLIAFFDHLADLGIWELGI